MANVNVPATGEALLKDAAEGGTVFPVGGMFFGDAAALTRVKAATGLPTAFDTPTKALFGALNDAAAADGAVTDKGIIALLKGLLREMIEASSALAGTLQASGTFTEGPSTAVKFARIDTAALGATQLVAAVAGKKLRVLNFHLIAAGAVNVSLRSAANPITGAYPLVANAGLAPNGGGFGLCETAAGEALNINLSAAVQVSGAIAYVEI